MNYYIFFFGLSIIIFFSILISLNTKNESTNEEFFLGNRNIGFISLVFTLVATQLGGGAILGACDEAYRAGPFACFYTLGQSLGLIILSLGIGNRLRKLNIITISEIFEKQYNSKFLRKFTSLISIISLFGILVSMAVSSRSFIKALGIKTELILIIFWLVLVFYTTQGGLKAVIYTDVLQAIVLLSILFIVLIYALKKNPWSIKNIITDYNFKNALDIGKKQIFSWFLMPFLFTFVEQDLAQRFFAAKSSKVIFFASLTAAFILILSTTVPIFFGMLASVSNLEIKDNNSIFLSSVINLTNPIFAGLAACAVLSAIISTADSILMGISSNICSDFNLMKSKNKMIFPKLITATVGILALIVSFNFSNIISILIKSYELSICCILIPTFISLFGFTQTKKSAYGSVIFGLISFIIFNFIKTPLPPQIVSIIFSLLGYLLFFYKK